MKKVFYLLLTVFLLTVMQVSGQENHGRRGRMSMPVYAPKPDAKQQMPVLTPEQRAKFGAARKRRFEIMVLIGAYKIMPLDQREALKAELLKRIEADFKASMQTQKDRIAKAEAELKKLRAELAEKEANSSKLIASELDRLLKMPMPNRRGPRQNKNAAAPKEK